MTERIRKFPAPEDRRRRRPARNRTGRAAARRSGAQPAGPGSTPRPGVRRARSTTGRIRPWRAQAPSAQPRPVRWRVRASTAGSRRRSVGVDGPRRHQACQNEVAVDLRQRRPSVEQISRIGMDTSKHIFQLHGVNTAERPVLRKKLRRKEMFAFLEQLAPTVIAIEACGASHHCARLLQSFGHSVKLIAPQLVKPYLKRGKNDAADAEALCEAMSRPTMRFVPVKTAEQQAALMLVGVRDRLIRNRTQLSNAIRGYAGEFGLTAARGKAHLDPLLERIQANESLPALARELFAAQAEEYAQLQAQIDKVDARLIAWHRADECSLRHIVAWRPVLVAGVWVATHIGGFIHHLGTTPPCRSSTMPNTAWFKKCCFRVTPLLSGSLNRVSMEAFDA